MCIRDRYNDETQEHFININNQLLPSNIFQITGMTRQEIRHSNVLAWMFGANEHSLVDTILIRFLSSILSKNERSEIISNLRTYIYLPDKKEKL